MGANHDTSHPALPWLLMLLSVTTGLVDAISVLGLGKVFTANMTGNVVFLGFAAAGTQGFRIAPYLVAIATFMVGALVAGRLARVHDNKSLHRWLIAASAAEGGLLWIAAGLAVGFDIATQSPDWAVFALIGLTAVAMGLRNGTMRELKVPDLTTTVLTLTVTGIAADSSLAGGKNPNWKRRLASIVSIFLGATLGAYFVGRWGLALPLFFAGSFTFLGTIACAVHSTRPAVSRGHRN